MTYGCFNRRPYTTQQRVADGYYVDGYTQTARLILIPVRGEPACQYTHSALGQADPRCRGCTWRHNESTPTAATEGTT